VATLVRYTGLSERTVRTCLDRLEADGIISPCDPDIVAARIKRADRCPQGWDLHLGLVRDDLDELGVAVPDGRSPPVEQRTARLGGPIMKAIRAGCNHRTPPPGLWITWLTVCSSCSPQP
jgi:hypothetical protein